MAPGVGASNYFEAGGFIRSREEFAAEYSVPFLAAAINYNGSNAGKSTASTPCLIDALAAVGMCD